MPQSVPRIVGLLPTIAPVAIDNRFPYCTYTFRQCRRLSRVCNQHYRTPSSFTELFANSTSRVFGRPDQKQESTVWIFHIGSQISVYGFATFITGVRWLMSHNMCHKMSKRRCRYRKEDMSSLIALDSQTKASGYIAISKPIESSEIAGHIKVPTPCALPPSHP